MTKLSDSDSAATGEKLSLTIQDAMVALTLVSGTGKSVIDLNSLADVELAFFRFYYSTGCGSQVGTEVPCQGRSSRQLWSA
jgi:hypothetical protein